MPFAIWPFLQMIGTSVWSFASSRAGQIIIAFAVAWVWSGWRSDDHWKAVIAAEKAYQKAAYEAEIARQTQAAQDIAAAATIRAEEDSALERELRAQIQEFIDQEKPDGDKPQPAAKGNSCNIDHDFSQFVRKLDYLDRGRKGKASRPAK